MPKSTNVDLLIWYHFGTLKKQTYILLNGHVAERIDSYSTILKNENKLIF